MPELRILMKQYNRCISILLILLLVQIVLVVDGRTSPLESLDSSTTLNATGEKTSLPAVVHRSLAGRHRLELRMGYWDSGQHQQVPSYMYTDGKTRVEDLLGAFSYSYWGADKLAADLTLRGLVVDVHSINRATRISESAVVVTSAMFGIRFYPISSARTPLRPYFIAGLGPYIGVESHEEIDNHSIRIAKTTKTLATFGSFFGGGLDIQMNRYVMMGFHMGYNLMSDFSEPLGSKNNFSGLELSAGISLLL